MRNNGQARLHPDDRRPARVRKMCTCRATSERVSPQRAFETDTAAHCASCETRKPDRSPDEILQVIGSCAELATMWGTGLSQLRPRHSRITEGLEHLQEFLALEAAF